MLSNLSDLLFSRVDPDPVQSQTSMVGMSPQSQAQAMQQQVAPAQAQYLQAAGKGKPRKTPQNVLDYLKSMEEGGIYTPPGQVPTYLTEGAKVSKGEGQTIKEFNAMTTNMSAANPTGVITEDPYKALLKGDYTALNPKYFGGSSEKASMAESDMMKFKRSRMGGGISEEELNKMLYFREQADEKRAELLKPGNLSRKQIDEKVLQHIKSLGYKGY
jgi:hypothetical protein